MTERLQQPPGSARRTARVRTPRSRAGSIWGARTIPDAAAGGLAPESEPTLLGFPAEFAEEDDLAQRPVGGAASDASELGLVVLRRADRFGAGALVLAGVAANVSLSLSWSAGAGPAGLSLVQQGVEALGSGVGEAALSGVWQPLVVVLSGGLLVLLGLLLLVPARAHRLVGVLALVVALVAATAVAVLIVDSGGGLDRFGPGMWCAVAVPVLGVLGSLKAMLTAPRVTLAPC
jgi:hypothetical protein